MNYAQLIRDDVANGPGMRLSLFVSGCSRHCPGCFNECAWDPSYGKPFDGAAMDMLVAELGKPWYQGFSLLGGEPFEPCNREGVLGLLNMVHDACPGKDVWAYTGYLYEELMGDPVCRDILGLVDVLVDGPFIQERKDVSLCFRGSSNQRILDLKVSCPGHVVLSPWMGGNPVIHQ